MGASFVNTGNKESDTVRTTAVVLGVDLGFIGDGVYYTGYRDGAVVQEAGGHGLLAHEIGEDAGVGGEAGEGDAEVGVDA